MSQGFISNVALGIAGAVIVVSTQAFTPHTTGWLAFGVSLGALALLTPLQRERGQRMLDVEVGLLALWSAVASVVYTGTTLKWLSFGEGVGFAALAVAGLIVHELRTERVVHALQAVPAPDEADELQAAA